ncbi:hypothetical protein BBO99_00000346 [Phytophthora kernoviae]|uniref:Alpha/beta hydrolase fold-3 domain-containing protein n=2 Tax=Phytophthora kernoviae TaxID=325452 RepID=A0A3R7KZD7_9STRA|nr:hypothetical protein G195_000770 [Phytophthora kernoviae 00238/432]KAG2532794.1 hypothetical protein JM16_000104 [Phytophthora kernoviae]KAG2533516.1 hypothetical protein JM18_000106 [Phytophthora kernoviae]RLN86055.1 hypothetical protein BBO99_00000346 [Phytophthora kernoviae]
MEFPPRPPYDAELKVVMDQEFANGMPLHYNVNDLPALRAQASSIIAADSILALCKGGIHEQRTIAGPNGPILVSILRPSTFNSTNKHAAILFYHPGGMVIGNRFTGLASLAPYLDTCNAIIVSPEYRLAPEHLAPEPFEDAYTAYKWIGDNMAELCIDPSRFMVAGTSGGGAICAGVTLLARERGGPEICGQLLVAPMLDDRNDSISARQFEVDGGRWSTRSNRFAWDCVLGARSGTEDVKDFEAPGRAKDLFGLPPTYLEVGSAEVCRDEVVAYANAEVSKKALWSRHRWVETKLREKHAGPQHD